MSHAPLPSSEARRPKKFTPMYNPIFFFLFFSSLERRRGEERGKKVKKSIQDCRFAAAKFVRSKGGAGKRAGSASGRKIDIKFRWTELRKSISKGGGERWFKQLITPDHCWWQNPVSMVTGADNSGLVEIPAYRREKKTMATDENKNSQNKENLQHLLQIPFSFLSPPVSPSLSLSLSFSLCLSLSLSLSLSQSVSILELLKFILFTV